MNRQDQGRRACFRCPLQGPRWLRKACPALLQSLPFGRLKAVGARCDPDFGAAGFVEA